MSTENFHLRPLEQRDLPVLVAWINNTSFSQMFGVKTPTTLSVIELWFGFVSEKKECTYFVFEKDGKIRAFGGLINISYETKLAEPISFVYPSLMNLGVNIEVVKSISSFGFQELGLNEIYLDIHSDDLVKRKVYEKCAFYPDRSILFEPTRRSGDLYGYYRYILRKGVWEITLV